MYRFRALSIADTLAAAMNGRLGLGADIITGFPRETDEDHQRELPVPQRVAGETSKELREIVQAKGDAYRGGGRVPGPASCWRGRGARPSPRTI